MTTSRGCPRRRWQPLSARRNSPVEVTKALLDRIEKINPSVNAYCLVTSEMALKQAEEAEVAVARATNSAAARRAGLDQGSLRCAGAADDEGFADLQGQRRDFVGVLSQGVDRRGWRTPRQDQHARVRIFIAMTSNKLFGTTVNPGTRPA